MAGYGSVLEGAAIGVSGLKRFYETAHATQSGEVWRVELDGRPARTRGRHLLHSRSRELAEAVAAEWAAQDEVIKPDAMPLTALLMTTIDLGEGESLIWRESILNYLGSDLLCYRASMPDALVARQNASWDPIIAWLTTAHGVELKTCVGVAPISQSADAMARADFILKELPAGELLALRRVTEITGSAGIALALHGGLLAPEALYAASRIDEDFQIEHWGADAEATAREEIVRRDYDAAAQFLALVRATTGPD